MKHFKVLSILIFITVCPLLNTDSQVQTGEDIPELVELTAADTGLTADMTRGVALYTDLMLATYYRLNGHRVSKSKVLYDSLIARIENTRLDTGPLSAHDISFIYAERASLRFPKLRDPAGAKADAEVALHHNRENVQATYVLAQIVTTRFINTAERTGNISRTAQKEMFELLNRVVDLDPDHQRALSLRGTLARNLGEHDLAIASFKALTRIMPYEAEYHLELADLYELDHRLDAAVQALQRVVTIRPEETSLQNRLGHLYLKTGDTHAAVRTFAAVLAHLDAQADRHLPRDTEIEAHQGIGLAYQAQNGFERAEYHITRAITLLKAKAKQSRTGSRSSERIEVARQLQTAQQTLGHIYLKFNEPQKAIQTFTEILKGDADAIPALSGIGSAYQLQDDLKTAETFLRRAIDLADAHEVPETYNALAYLYAKQGIHLEEAATLVRRALKSNPTSGAYLDTLGLIYLKQGQLEKALETLEQALDALPDTPEILLHLADVYLLMGQLEKARETLQHAVRLDPDNAELREKLETLN